MHMTQDRAEFSSSDASGAGPPMALCDADNQYVPRASQHQVFVLHGAPAHAPSPAPLALFEKKAYIPPSSPMLLTFSSTLSLRAAVVCLYYVQRSFVSVLSAVEAVRYLVLFLSQYTRGVV